MQFTLVTVLLAGVALQAQAVDFLKDVQPVLTARCMGCHSGESAQAGLKTHTRDDLLRGGKSGPAIVPGSGGESLLVQRMEGKQGVRMPPSGPPVPAETIDRIRLWIDAGARFEAAASAPPERKIAPLGPRTPVIPDGTAVNPIDRFIDAYFAEKRIEKPQITSDARFARRIWFDITGVPPTPEELKEFTASTASDKRSRAIDRLLLDRRNYAEHWISFWNDLLRNDEGVIYHGERKSITTWLLDALMTNMPYDRMVSALLNPKKKKGPEGFLTGVTWRGVISASQTPPMQAAQNAAQVFLGMNLKCAACHDGFINQWKLQDTYGLASMFSDKPLELVRCDVPLGKVSEARFPLPGLKVDFGEKPDSRRTAAAKWFVHPGNGRFARTIVNRYWRQLVGRGLVEPVDDMDAPSWNTDLLDWLASDFVAHKYDLQHLIRCITTSEAYGMESVAEASETPETYVFRGPHLRRLTAEQFEDAISAVTGDWRLSSPRSETYASWTREWRLKSDPLSRALGRPIRDQVYTERSDSATTLQALELTNGPLLSRRLEHGARQLLGELPPAPGNVFDSKVVRRGAIPIDLDITGAKELWLVIEDVDSYDPSRVIAGWIDPQLKGPKGMVSLEAPTRELELKEGTFPAVIGAVPSMLRWDIAGKGYTRFRTRAAVDERSRPSDIGPAIRFFVFTEKPNPDQLIRVQGSRPYALPAKIAWSSESLAERLYTHLLGRAPAASELRIATEILGEKPAAAAVEDLLWAILMLPEFQYIH